jgi:hypothetical protein
MPACAVAIRSHLDSAWRAEAATSPRRSASRIEITILKAKNITPSGCGISEAASKLIVDHHATIRNARTRLMLTVTFVDPRAVWFASHVDVTDKLEWVYTNSVGVTVRSPIKFE